MMLLLPMMMRRTKILHINHHAVAPMHHDASGICESYTVEGWLFKDVTVKIGE